MDRAEAAQRVAGHVFLGPRPIRLQHLAGVGQREDWFDAAGNIVYDQRDQIRSLDWGVCRLLLAEVSFRTQPVRAGASVAYPAKLKRIPGLLVVGFSADPIRCSLATLRARV
jgi:hypothetical protein